MVRNVLVYKPTERQMVFHMSNAKNRLYGGAAGGGKTKAIRMEAVRIAQSGKGLIGLVVRRTFPELYKSIIQPLLEELPKGTYTYNQSKNFIKFHKTGSMIYFGHIQYESDVLNYQGAEFDFIGMDELTHFSEYMYKYLKSRLRTAKVGVKTCFFATTNPGGLGHVRVKRMWIDKELTDKEARETFEYIPARVYDNPYLMENDPDYVNSLEAMDGDDRRALLDGDWDIFAGQYFSERRQHIHVVEPFEIPRTWRRYRGLDYGYTAPSAVYWGAEDPDGNIYIYKEIYGPGFSYPELADEIISMESSPEEAEALLRADPALKAKSPDTKESFFDIATAKHIPILPATHDRIPGWQILRKYLKRSDSTTNPPRAKLRVFSTCEHLIRTLPQMIHDKNRVEDINTLLEDHAVDAVRYLLMGISGGPGSLKEVSQSNQKAVNKKNRVIKMRF